ncbi:MAG: diguanylate cyclase [Pseudanabaena frigida]|uniref:Circadian input-output histidine kinase CikA n=1 Tax=Pseudanabaena frigida TaxID=945775 RepID=A0A2W4Y0N7_9CYAN|nr:MAG: diguanylate cyclase [Pseudanabaena frigida]
MDNSLKVLIVEDSEDDALLIVRELRHGGFEITWECVETSQELLLALSSRKWDILLSDYHLPALDIPSVLKIVKQVDPDLPFIVVSGTIGESAAVELMRQGVNDYLMKGHLARLTEVIKREIRESQIRAEKRKADIELDRTKERLQLAIEGSGIGLWDWSISTGEVTFNDRWAEMIGYTTEELQPVSIEVWQRNIHPEDLPRVTQSLEQHFQRETETHECELRMLHKLGAWVWVLCKGKVTEWDTTGKPLRMIGTLLDVSGRKQTIDMLMQLNQNLETRVRERTSDLRQSESRLQEAQQIAHLGSWELDVQTKAITWSEEVFKIFGLDSDLPEPTYAELLDYFPQGDRFTQFIDRSINTGESDEIDLQIIRANGSTGYIFVKIEVIKNESEQVIRLFGIVMNISDRKLVQQELQQENTFRQKIVESMAEGLCVCHEINEFPFLQFTVWNQQMQIITGYSLEEINQLGWEQSLHPMSDNQIQTIDRVDMTQREGISEEWRIQRKDGKRLTISMSRSVISSDDGKSYLLALIQDITDRKQSELKLQQKVNQEHLLVSITQRMRSSLNLEEILKDTVEEIHQVLQSDRVLVYRVFAGGHGAAIAESVSPQWSKVLDMVLPEEVFPEAIYDRYVQGRIYKLSDREDPNQTILPCLVEFLAEIQVRAKLVVPIIQHKQNQQTLWGLLIVHQCDRPRQWQSWEIDLLKQISNQLAIAIQQSDLYYQLQCELQERQNAEKVIRQQVVRESLLREITQRIRQSLDLQTIFEIAVQEVQQFLNADRVGIFKFYPESNFDDGEFVAESVVEGFSSALAIRVHDHTFGDNYAALYANGRAYIVDDIYQNGAKVCHIDILAQFQVRANIVMPLLCKDVLWGLLCIHQCATTRHWQQSEIDFSYQVTNQLAIAIQQASLFEQLQQELSDLQQAEAKLTESNQKLAISNEELSRATRLKDEFLANMSHELRTPLNSILGMTEGMQEGVFGTISDRQAKALKTVERSGIHLLELINDILDVAKIESGEVTLELTTTSVQQLCQSSMTFVKQQAHSKSIQLIDRIPENLPDLLLDERRIRQVLINLLNNAVKFTPHGGSITLEVSVVDSNQTTDPTYLRMAVIDTGIGISSENIPKLFQPFIQIDSALNRQYVGTGLGLALVKRIVEMHGGRVLLTSEPNMGSCFMVDIPYITSTHSIDFYLKPEAKIDSTLQVSQSPTLSNLILLAEDNEANINTISCYLEAKGYRILLAKNGQEAIAVAKTHQPNLILMDIQMPVMDGLEATTLIRLDPQLHNIPIIAMTALAMTGDREKCLEAGADEYLTKPVKLKQLTTIIQQFLIENKNQK